MQEKKQTSLRVAFVSSHFYHHSIGQMLIKIMQFMKSGAGSAEYGHLELFAFFLMEGRAQDDQLTAAFADLLKGEEKRDFSISK